MASEETTYERPVEHVIIAYAANVQLRQEKLDLEELIFLYDAIGNTIANYKREMH